jgi:hypothetical protein
MSNGNFYLNSSSPGAPQLNTNAGCLIAILDWALDVPEAGYGGTRGWNKVYDNGANVVVYRATTGIRPFLKVSDNQANYAYMRMYEDMPDPSTLTGTNPCPNGSPQSTSYCMMHKANEGGGHTYYVVGDGRFFFFMGNLHNTYTYKNFAPFFFGEYNSFDPLDSYNAIISGTWPVAPAYSQYKRSIFSGGIKPCNMWQSTSYVATADNPTTFHLRSPDGLILSSGGGTFAPFDVMRDGRSSNRFAHFGASPALVYQPWYIYDSNGSSGGNPYASFPVRGSTGYLRGSIPYIYDTPYCAYTGSVNGAQVTDGISTFRTLDYVGDSISQNVAEYVNVMMLRDSNDEPGRDFVI